MEISVFRAHWLDDLKIDYLPFWGQFRRNCRKVTAATATETRYILGYDIRFWNHLQGRPFMSMLPSGFLLNSSLRFSVFLERFSSLDGGKELLPLFLGVLYRASLFSSLIALAPKNWSSPWAWGSRWSNSESVYPFFKDFVFFPLQSVD